MWTPVELAPTDAPSAMSRLSGQRRFPRRREPTPGTRAATFGRIVNHRGRAIGLSSLYDYRPNCKQGQGRTGQAPASVYNCDEPKEGVAATWPWVLSNLGYIICSPADSP
jgi:hypothetical protein